MIADKLRDLRKSEDLLQTDMASIVGCSTGTISNIENGRDPDLDVLRAYCKHFNVTADYILDLSQDPRPASGDINKKLVFLHQLSNADTLLTEDLLNLINAITRYIRTGRPAGESADRDAVHMIRAITAVLNAAASADAPALLEASTAVISQAAAISHMPAELFKHLQQDA